MLDNLSLNLQSCVHLYNYSIIFAVMTIGLLIIVGSQSPIKKLLGLNIFQSAVILLYISVGYVSGGIPPIIDSTEQIYVNPLPHVLMLTAIVVGVATLTLGLTFAVMIVRSEHS